MENTNTSQNLLGDTLTLQVVPSISSSAMLVDFGVSQWTAKKKDRKASSEVTSGNNAEAGVANVIKSILGDSTELTEIGQLTSKMRIAHQQASLPWSDNGTRLLPTEQYFSYHNRMTEYKAELYTTS